MKAMDFDKYLEEQLKRPAFRKAYDELEEEYEVAKQIIKHRLSRNLTQAQLAKLVGTSQPAIARLESGNHRNLTLGFLARVARALDLRPEMRFRARRGHQPLRMADSQIRPRKTGQRSTAREQS
jgi:transcriptional regulator with XRE-family HTH domain